jgi:murein DD-endopeptidase MepM/ murein hydrolase activator NlpD
VDPATTPDAQRLEQLQQAYTGLQESQNLYTSASARLAGVLKQETDASTALATAQQTVDSAQGKLDVAARQAFIGKTTMPGYKVPAYVGGGARPWLDDRSASGAGTAGIGQPATNRTVGTDQELAASTSGMTGLIGELSVAQTEAAKQRQIMAQAQAQRSALETQVVTLQKTVTQRAAVVTGLQGQVASSVSQGILARPASPAPGVPSSGSAPITGASSWTGGKLSRPVDGTMSSPFGNRLDPYYHRYQLHAGLDLAASQGTPIRAAAPGRVVQAGWNGGYGYYTCIEHGTFTGQRLTTCYGHQSLILVQPGQTVTAGQVIGAVGSTGASTGPHLHFEVRLGGRPVDPTLWL